MYNYDNTLQYTWLQDIPHVLPVPSGPVSKCSTSLKQWSMSLIAPLHHCYIHTYCMLCVCTPVSVVYIVMVVPCSHDMELSVPVSHCWIRYHSACTLQCVFPMSEV